MASLTPLQSAAAAQQADLTPTQQQALKRLHVAAQQFEGVFLGMLFKEMQASVPSDSLFGDSSSEQTFTEMLNQQRAQEMAQTGSFGIGKILEQQLRGAVLSDSAHEAKGGIPQEGIGL